MKKKKIGRPSIPDKDKKVNIRLRIDPKVKAKLIKDHGTITKAVDEMVLKYYKTA